MKDGELGVNVSNDIKIKRVIVGCYAQNLLGSLQDALFHSPPPLSSRKPIPPFGLQVWRRIARETIREIDGTTRWSATGVAGTLVVCFALLLNLTFANRAASGALAVLLLNLILLLSAVLRGQRPGLLDRRRRLLILLRFRRLLLLRRLGLLFL